MSSFLAIVFIELPSQPVGLDADNIVALRIKVMRSAKHLRCNRVFLNFINSPCPDFSTMNSRKLRIESALENVSLCKMCCSASRRSSTKESLTFITAVCFIGTSMLRIVGSSNKLLSISH